MMKGMRLPIFVLVLSDQSDTSGIRKMARMLSRVMTPPIIQFFWMNLPRKMGTYVS